MRKRDWATAGVIVLMVAASVGLFGIPYNWCRMCAETYPDWYCWLGGCW